MAQQFYKAVGESKGIPLRILSDDSESDATLFIRTGSEVEGLKGVAWFRGNGMLIRRYQPKGIFRPYAAVLVARGELDKLLRKTEPARHNDWDYKRLPKGSADRALARKAIAKIRSEVKTQLNKACKSIVDSSIDAIGAANYLPDSLGGGTQEGGGNDILRPLIKISRVKKSRQPCKTETIMGKRGVGTQAAGSIGNKTSNPKPEANAKPSNPVGGPGTTPGIKPGRGSKTIERPVDGILRVFSLAPGRGIYRLVLISGESAKGVYASCSSVGENGAKEPLAVTKAMMDGHGVHVEDGSVIGPFEVSKGRRSEIIITFEDRSNMALDVNLTTRGTRR